MLLVRAEERVREDEEDGMMETWDEEFLEQLRSDPLKYAEKMAEVFEQDMREKCIRMGWVQEAARYFRDRAESLKDLPPQILTGHFALAPQEPPKIEPIMPPWVEKMQTFMEEKRVRILPVAPGTKVWMVGVDVHNCRQCGHLESCMRQGYMISGHCISRKPTGKVCEIKFYAGLEHAWGKLIFATYREACNAMRKMEANT